MTKTNIQQNLTSKALEQLATIGGKMTKESDIVFEGNKFILPERFRSDLNGMASWINDYASSMEEEVTLRRQYDYRPYDGAHAVQACLRDVFGMSQGKTLRSLFGKTPPQEVSIPVGFENGKLVNVNVPWGAMVLPGLKGATLYISSHQHAEKGALFMLAAECKKKDREIVEGFFEVVGRYLRDDGSIYKGKAIDGAASQPSFFDTERINPELFVYTEETWAQLETNILSPIRDAATLKSLGMPGKRVVLLEGPYGSGKSGALQTASKVAVENGYTSILCRPGVDDPFEVLKTARMYQPAAVFIEDVDTISSDLNDTYVSKLLDAFDGYESKGTDMVLVMTTNHADKIHKGMLRPGRLDAVIHIGEMDRPGVEKLTRLVIGDKLEDDVNFDAVFGAVTDFTPAYVREAIDRSVRFAIARTGEVSSISTDDLVHACQSLRPQLAMQQAAKDREEPLPTLDAAFRQAVSIASGIDPDDIEGVDYDHIEARVDNVVENRIDRAGVSLEMDSGRTIAGHIRTC